MEVYMNIHDVDLRPVWEKSLEAVLPAAQSGQEGTMRPYITVTGMALGLVAMWATLVHLLA
jgi:hypothetical protein